MDPENTFENRYSSGVWVKDSTIEVRLSNSEHSVASAVLFRLRPRDGYSLIVRKDGVYYFDWIGDSSGGSVQEFFSNAIDTTPEGSNHIRIVARDDAGTLYINGKLLTSLDLSDVLEAGDIVLISFGDAGYETRFEDFAIWSPTFTPTPTPSPTPLPMPSAPLLFGPVSGSVKLDPENIFENRYSSGVWVRDATIDVRFPNSEHSKGGGVVFRLRPTDAYTLVVRIDSGYYHFRRASDESSERVIFSDAIDTTPGGSNHIRIVAKESVGNLYINGEHVAELDLSGFLEAGDIALYSSGVLGYEARFENFTIWSPEYAVATPTPRPTVREIPVEVVVEVEKASPTPGLVTPRDAAKAGIEAGEALRRQRKLLTLETLREAVSMAEASLFGTAAVWEIDREDIRKACELYQSSITTEAELEAALWRLDLKGSALVGAISGLGDAANNAPEVTIFCLSFQ